MLPPLRVKPRREDVPAEVCLCEHCTAKCCRYFALPLETPEARKDFDTLRWFLLHQRTTIFVEKNTWYLLVHNECRHLQPSGRCGIYETRPNICRAYSTKNCEYDDECTYDQYFETPEQLEEYVEARFPKHGKARRSPKPGLPILRTLPR